MSKNNDQNKHIVNLNNLKVGNLNTIDDGHAVNSKNTNNVFSISRRKYRKPLEVDYKRPDNFFELSKKEQDRFMKKYTQKRKEAEAKVKAEAEMQRKSQGLRERTNSSMSSQLAKEKHKYHMQKNAEKQEKAEIQRKIQELEEDTNGPKENLLPVEKRLEPISNKKLPSNTVNGNKNHQEVNYQESIHDKTSDDEDNIGGFVKTNGYIYKYYELKVRMYDEINHEDEIKNPFNLPRKSSYTPDSRQINGSKYSKCNVNKSIYSVQLKEKGDDGKPMTKKMFKEQSLMKFETVNGKRYMKLNMLGAGASSRVFKVIDFGTLEVLALKIIDIKGVSQNITNLYRTEIEVLKEFTNDPHVIQLLEFEFIENAEIKLIFELGTSNFVEYLKFAHDNQYNPIGFAKFRWKEMVLAVKALHDKGIVHCDLKMDNFVVACGKVKVIDLGLALKLGSGQKWGKKYEVQGTPDYLAPEAIIGYPSVDPNANEGKLEYLVGFPADIWGLGCILYTMIYGRSIFNRKYDIPQIRLVLRSSAPIENDVEFGDKIKAGEGFMTVPKSLKRLIKACLVKDPEKRISIHGILNHLFLEGV